MSNVFVLGNAGVDLSLTLAHLVLPGETTVASDGVRAPGGKGLNQAVVAARAGARVKFCAPVGDDAEAAFVTQCLAAEPFAELRLIPKPGPTDISIVMVAGDGENSIVSLCKCADMLSEQEAASFASETSPADWLLLQGNLTEAATLAAVQAARGYVMLNAAPLRWPVAPMLALCTVLVVNRGEAESITGLANPDAAAMKLCAQGCSMAIVTVGANGCIWANAKERGSLPAIAVHPLDTTGAGDTFCGVLVAHLASGMHVRDAVTAAQQAAALSVTRLGAYAALPTETELGFLRQQLGAQ